MISDESEKMKKRKTMIAKADELISSLAMRKNKVTNLLEGNTNFLYDWGMIKQASLIPGASGQILANHVLSTQWREVEPVLQQFSEDLVAIRTKVTLILSNLGDDEPDDSMFIPGPEDDPSPARKFITIIQVIHNMSMWSSDIMDTWVDYHIARAQLKEGIDVQRLMFNPNYKKTDDICLALLLLDCKMAKEMRSMLNTIMLNYITMEDIVLDATGTVAETPRSPSYCSLYV